MWNLQWRHWSLYPKQHVYNVYHSVYLFLLDSEELQRENAIMRNMMLCKGCGARATCINKSCGHLMCIACCKMPFCKICGSQITEVVGVKFSHQKYIVLGPFSFLLLIRRPNQRNIYCKQPFQNIISMNKEKVIHNKKKLWYKIGNWF